MTTPTNPTAPEPVEPFENVASADLDARAAELVKEGAVSVSYIKNTAVSSLRIDGPCPRCEHRFSQTRALQLPVTSIRGGVPTRDVSATAAAAAAFADFLCECIVVHPGTPPGASGCGANYTVYRAVSKAP